MGCSISTGPLSKRTSSAAVERQFHEEYVLGEKIGEGAFGLILLASVRSEIDSPLKSDSRAVKVIPLRDEDGTREAREEVLIWQLATGHSNIVGLHDAFFESSICYMVMELCTCSVMDHLQCLRQAGESDLGIVIRGMLMGLAHCSSSSVAHRDVKPDNILLGPPERGSACRTVKLADFGLAATLPRDGFLFDVVGTASYMSPEMVCQSGYDVGTDVWSLGVVTYLMLFGEFPFGRGSKTADTMKQAIARGMAPRFQPADANLREPSLDAMDFVRTVLSPRVSTRPKALDVLELAFMERSATAEPATEVEVLEADTLARSVAEVVATENTFLLQPVLSEAQKVTAEFRRMADPTVQRDLANLLQKLQGQPKSQRSFEAEDVPSRPTSALLDDTAMPLDHSMAPIEGSPISSRKSAPCERGASLFSDSPTHAPTTATFPSSASGESGGAYSLGPPEPSPVIGPRPSPLGSQCTWIRQPELVRAEQPPGMCLGEVQFSMVKPVCPDDTRHSL